MYFFYRIITNFAIIISPIIIFFRILKGKEDTKKLDKYGNKVYDNTKGANIPVGSDH